jgi:hypothetical protein
MIEAKSNWTRQSHRSCIVLLSDSGLQVWIVASTMFSKFKQKKSNLPVTSSVYLTKLITSTLGEMFKWCIDDLGNSYIVDLITDRVKYNLSFFLKKTETK